MQRTFVALQVWAIVIILDSQLHEATTSVETSGTTAAPHNLLTQDTLQWRMSDKIMVLIPMTIGDNINAAAPKYRVVVNALTQSIPTVPIPSRIGYEFGPAASAQKGADFFVISTGRSRVELAPAVLSSACRLCHH